ncbi:MAG: hypothetical protein O2931_03605 [Planctomycetota bacterium]|nr:hypothetical protein [Planctomycetota bacterium]MDA1177863.1 hypothetical protein [Planctomycetota bacterium]
MPRDETPSPIDRSPIDRLTFANPATHFWEILRGLVVRGCGWPGSLASDARQRHRDFGCALNPSAKG